MDIFTKRWSDGVTYYRKYDKKIIGYMPGRRDDMFFITKDYAELINLQYE